MKNQTKEIAKDKFEFILSVDNNIICQRDFMVNNYNRKSTNSLEIKEMMDNITGMNGPLGRMGIIPDFFKRKSIDYLWEQPYNNDYKANYNNNFYFKINVNGKTLATSYFSGTCFQPAVRGDINIRAIIPAIMSEIRSGLAKRTYTSAKA